MSWDQHNEECSAHPNLMGKCEDCTVAFLDMQAQALERFLSTWAEGPKDD